MTKALTYLFVDFELALLGGSTVDDLFIALCCVSIAAPIPEIHSQKKYARCNYDKMARNPYVIISINMAMT